MTEETLDINNTVKQPEGDNSTNIDVTTQATLAKIDKNMSRMADYMATRKHCNMCLDSGFAIVHR